MKQTNENGRQMVKESRLLIGGLPATDGPLARDYFAEPNIFANVRRKWRICRKEIFGPVLVAIPWIPEAEPRNDGRYGLLRIQGFPGDPLFHPFKQPLTRTDTNCKLLFGNEGHS